MTNQTDNLYIEENIWLEDTRYKSSHSHVNIVISDLPLGDGDLPMRSKAMTRTVGDFSS